SLNGYVITGMTDVHWEVNGLLDMWRNEKVYAQELSALQKPDIVFCELPAYSFFSGQQIEIDVFISHFSDLDLKGARLRWFTDAGATGEFAISDLASGTVKRVTTIRLTVAHVKEVTTDRLELEIRLRNGHRIA